MKRSLLLFGALLSSTALFAGCGGAPSVSEVRWELQRRFPEARFDPEEHVHLGRFTMGLVHGIVGLAASDEDGREGAEIVRQIKAVDFASYKVHGLPDLDRLAGDVRFARQLAQNGWSLMVRTREEHESTWVYVRSTPDGVLRNLFVVSLERDELTLVRVDGRLDRVLAEAMARDPKKALGDGHKRGVKTAAVAAPAGAP